jgi:hypothetical protein
VLRGVARVGMFTGLFGAALLTAGVFLPAYRLSSVFYLNFSQLHIPRDWSAPDALEQVWPLLVVGAGALFGLLFSIAGLYALAGLAGMLALSGVVFSAWRLNNLAHHADPNVPLFLGFQWGWGVLLFGAILLVATGFMPRRSSRPG